MHVDDPPAISASRSWGDERPVKKPNPEGSRGVGLGQCLVTIREVVTHNAVGDQLRSCHRNRNKRAGEDKTAGDPVRRRIDALDKPERITDTALDCVSLRRGDKDTDQKGMPRAKVHMGISVLPTSRHLHH
jgi:hypothetical protein